MKGNFLGHFYEISYKKTDFVENGRYKKSELFIWYGKNETKRPRIKIRTDEHQAKTGHPYCTKNIIDGSIHLDFIALNIAISKYLDFEICRPFRSIPDFLFKSLNQIPNSIPYLRNTSFIGVD